MLDAFVTSLVLLAPVVLMALAVVRLRATRGRVSRSLEAMRDRGRKARELRKVA
jgi:hypothetical protein